MARRKEENKKTKEARSEVRCRSWQGLRGPEQIFSDEPTTQSSNAFVWLVTVNTFAPRLANVSPRCERQTHYRLEVESCVSLCSLPRVAECPGLSVYHVTLVMATDYPPS